jgi:hypothetical protein
VVQQSPRRLVVTGLAVQTTRFMGSWLSSFVHHIIKLRPLFHSLEAYDANQVKLFISNIRDFVTRHPA